MDMIVPQRLMRLEKAMEDVAADAKRIHRLEVAVSSLSESLAALMDAMGAREAVDPQEAPAASESVEEEEEGKQEIFGGTGLTYSRYQG